MTLEPQRGDRGGNRGADSLRTPMGGAWPPGEQLRERFCLLGMLLGLSLWWSCPPGHACPGGSFFIPDEFSGRCGALLERLDEYRQRLWLKHPDLPLARQKLVDEWITFYIDHGDRAPEALESLAPGWGTTTLRIGRAIFAMCNETTAPAGFDECFADAALPLYLLADIRRLSGVHQTTASLTRLIADAAMADGAHLASGSSPVPNPADPGSAVQASTLDGPVADPLIGQLMEVRLALAGAEQLCPPVVQRMDELLAALGTVAEVASMVADPGSSVVNLELRQQQLRLVDEWWQDLRRTTFQ